MTYKNLKLNENESITGGKLHFSENVNVKPKVNNKDFIEQICLTEAKADGTSKLILKPRIEAIHAGRTRNGNIYPADKLKGDFSLKSGVFSFLYPYPKPMIKNHDHESEPTGRIKNAQFVTDSLTNREAVLIIPDITDPDTIEKILDGRYMTVSVGASTDAAICNICGTDILEEGWCGHERNQVYDGVECGWIVGNIFFDECSWVNVPADTDAMIVDAGEPILMEAYAQVGKKYYNLSSEKEAVELKESAAKLLGIHADESTEPKGGMGKMSKKADTATVESLLEEKTVLETTIAENQTVITEKETVIAEKETALAEKDTEITSLTEQLQEKETAIAEKDTAITERDTQIAEAKESLETSEAEKLALTEEVANLKAEKFQVLVERVIDLKEALGKPVAETREASVEEHLTRSEESLKDTLVDLMKEFTERSLVKNVVVVNPGAGAVVGEKNATIVGADGTEDKETKESLTSEDVLKNLFKGLYK